MNIASRPLDHLELLTLVQKDESYFKNYIGDDVQELAQRCLGVRKWMQFRSAITFVSRFVYFGLTALSNKPTLGEEYCEAFFNSSNNHYDFPTKYNGSLTEYLRKILMVVTNNELRWPPEVPKLWVNLFKDIHLATFFLFGDFYEMPKRITNYQYRTMNQNSCQSSRVTALYKLIGCMSLVKILITMSEKDHSDFITTNSCDSLSENAILNSIGRKSENKSIDRSIICHLCSGRRIEPTSTLCGHIFCWNCIHQWLKERAECPICRTPTESSRLVHLINYK